MIIAVDGPASTGKGTLARRLASEMRFAYLDTGLLYRAVGAALLESGAAVDDVPAAEAIAASLETDAVVNHSKLRTEQVGQAASSVAAMPGVRAVLLAFQRQFATHPPGGAEGAILDGRDIGTVICSDADLKLYLTANSKTRACRRFEELRAAGEPSIYADILKQMEERDKRDSERATAPSVPAIDAFVIDTTHLNADAVYAQAIEKLHLLRKVQQ